MSDDLKWMKDASCIISDTELFFSNNPDDTRKAISICNDCPVRILCANYAIKNNEEYGIWGGLTEAERKQLRGRRGSRAGIGNKHT